MASSQRSGTKSYNITRKSGLVFLLALVILAIFIETSQSLPSEVSEIKRVLHNRIKRQSGPGGGGYDAQRQDVGFGQGYGYSGYDEYCQDCAHCNGCGHAPNRRVLNEYDYTPKHD